MKILHFKTHAQIKDVLGRELINDDNVAVQELVKNSYDAGSKLVDIIFRNLKKNKDVELTNSNRNKIIANSSKILIIDQGCGMSHSDIENKWLNLAYSTKRKQRSSQGRIFAGAKGVGRFSCDRLGEFLDLYTKTKNSDRIIHLKINWNEFEDKFKVDDIVEKVDVYLDEPLTPEELEKRVGYKLLKSGTILEISKLRARWIERDGKNYSYEKIITLKKALQKLTNPNQNIEKESFKIRIQLLDFSKQDFDLKTDISKANYDILKNELVENKIFTQLNFKTTYIESILEKEFITTTLKYQDKIIFELKEKNVYDALKKVNIKIKLHFLNQYSKAYFKRYTGMSSREFGSIFLFVNGFRITPFGDFGNDWLGLEVRKGQGRARFLGARDLIGWIEINDNSGLFKIISNREGLVKNIQYQQLVGDTPKNFINSFYYSIFRKLESFVVDGLDWDRIYKGVKKKDDIEEDIIEEDEKTEIRKFMADFEAKIWSDKWVYDPSKERHAESEHEKNIRIISQVFKIITYGTKKKDIISLYIDEELLYELAEENIDFMKSFVEKIDEFDDINLSTKTSKGISYIKKVFAKMEARQKRTEEEKQKAEEKRKQAEEERDKAKDKAREEQTKREASEKRELFVKSLLGRNTEEILKLQHQIKIISGNIESAMLHLKEFVDKDELPTKEKLIEIISEMVRESQKIKKITEIVTSANFDMNSRKIKEDIVKFIKEYIEGFKMKSVETIINNSHIKFEMSFSPLELQIIIDNLYDNALKNGGKTMNVYFETVSNNKLRMKFTDDGKKIKKEQMAELFKFGFTTEKGGSGMGLYNIKQILDEMDCEINFIQNEKEKGFELVLRK